VCLASASRADGEVRVVCYRSASKCCFDTGHAERMRTRYPAIDSVANSVISILDDPPSSLGSQVLAHLKSLSITIDTGTQSVDARLSRPLTLKRCESY
jgi:hypothetical protein